MPGSSRLQLHTSNRLEQLVDDLALVLRRPLREPLRRETVVVQSLGMERWVTQQLARRHGICANIGFIFPQKLVAVLVDEALPGRAAAHFYARENLTWRIMQLLPHLTARREFAEPRRYLDGARPELRLFQLAGKIATAFDRYLAFRPELILQWERRPATDWQAILWREIAATAPGLHPPAVAEEFSLALARGNVRLPERVSLFGISSLPPFYLDFIEELARHTDVHLFLMRPTPEWWSDIRSEREELRARRKAPIANAQLEMEFERGNPLLASLGKLGRQVLESVTALNPLQEHDRSVAPNGDTTLSKIQRDIFQLHDGSTAAERATAAQDHTVQIHSCHSPMREMEVLHDQLLALFEKLPDLKPHDIAVMAPDISAYAPFIEAVFDTAPEPLRIPFSISDRAARAENGVIDTFLRILESVGSRFTASGVMSILESVPLQRRFDLTETDLDIVRRWIEKTGIRWGVDGGHRGALGLPEFAENSWRAGLDRLLLGYAAPAGGEQLFEGILAFDEVEGSFAETLGNFADFADALFAVATELRCPRSLFEWQETLRALAFRFFLADDGGEPELRQLRQVIDSLGDTAALSGFTSTVPLDVLLAHLEHALATSGGASGFLVGRTTFCALKPMRSVPFRVVCLVGMNDTAYPRHERAPAFDVVARNPQPGDRNRRDDDRYLFLETLLSARDVFYVSYVGQSSRDNSAIPPSVLVSELLDYTGGTAVQHRLQPFSSVYFTANAAALFSYSAENCAASEHAAGKRTAPPAFTAGLISEPEPEWHQLDATQLIRCMANPAKFFIEERLGLRLPRMGTLLKDSEPTEIDSLAKYKLQQDLLTHALRGEALEPLRPLTRASGELPPGFAGDAQWRALRDAAEHFAGLVRQHIGDAADAPREVRFDSGEFRLRARLDHLHGARLVRYRLTTRKPKDLLTTWIEHLAANTERATESVLITAEKEKPVLNHFRPLDPAKATDHLEHLLELYWRALREPLPIFPRSSLAFVEQTLHPKGKRSPLEVAQAKWRREPEAWEPDKGEKPEATDPYLRVAFRNVADPLDAAWEQLALEVFAPPLKAIAK